MYRPRFSLPAIHYVAVGREFNLYFNQAALVQDGMATITFSVNCAVGNIENGATGNITEGAFRWTPASAGLTEPLTLIAVDHNGKSVGSVSTTLISVEDDAGGSGAQRTMFIGDSITSAQIYVTEFGTLVAAGGGAGRIPVGIQGTSPDFHEGRTGRKFSFYAGATKPGFLFTVDHTAISVNPTLASGSKYTDLVSGETFTFWEDRIDEFDEMFLTGSGLPGASGTLTKTAGDGDATIAWTAVEAADQNPFWDGTRLDFRNYCDTYSQEFPDIVYLMLGINDIIIPGGVLETDADITAITADITTIIEAVQDATYGFPHCKVVVLVEPDGATLRAFGDDYDLPADLVATRDGMRKLSDSVITNFDAGAYDASVTVCGINLWVDKVHSYPESGSRTRNARDNARAIPEYQNNFPHPGTFGHEQMADGIYSHFRGIQPVLLNSLLASQDFDEAGFTYTSDADVTVTKNNLAPDGDSDAFKFEITGGPPSSVDPIVLTDPGGSVTDGEAGRHLASAFFTFDTSDAAHPYYIKLVNNTLAKEYRLYFWHTSINTLSTNPGVNLNLADWGGEEMLNLAGAYWRVWAEFDIPEGEKGDDFTMEVFPFLGTEAIGMYVTITDLQCERGTGTPRGYMETP